MILQEYEFEVVHRPRKTQQNADGLSRNPSPTLQWEAEDWAPADIELRPAALLALLADEQDKGEYDRGPLRPEDVWEDRELVEWLKQGPTGEDMHVNGPLRGRAQWYRWKEERLWRKLPEGWRVVPAPEEREPLFWHKPQTYGTLRGAMHAAAAPHGLLVAGDAGTNQEVAGSM